MPSSVCVYAVSSRAYHGTYDRTTCSAGKRARTRSTRQNEVVMAMECWNASYTRSTESSATVDASSSRLWLGELGAGTSTAKSLTAEAGILQARVSAQSQSDRGAATSSVSIVLSLMKIETYFVHSFGELQPPPVLCA